MTLTAYLKLSMWQCIEAEAVSCASGAGSGSDGPVRTTAVAEVETDDVDLAEAVFQCEAASDLTSAQKNSKNKKNIENFEFYFVFIISIFKHRCLEMPVFFF